MIAGFSNEEILHEVVVAPRAALIPLDDTRVIERPGWWQLVTPSARDQHRARRDLRADPAAPRVRDGLLDRGVDERLIRKFAADVTSAKSRRGHPRGRAQPG
jgi:hypothetical protein